MNDRCPGEIRVGDKVKIRFMGGHTSHLGQTGEVRRIFDGDRWAIAVKIPKHGTLSYHRGEVEVLHGS